ncbi:MAG: FAD-dependent oxidoreductase [Chloroflexi bacterium]|nr:FAD-dependent oxidoreductase [Chloroflexota bacterium]
MRKIFDVIKGFWSLLVGIFVTVKECFRKPITVQYPWERLKPADRFRGLLHIKEYFTEGLVSQKASFLPSAGPPPCNERCPAGTDARGYMVCIAEGRFRDGVSILKSTYPFAGTLGRVCPAPCETACNRNIANEAPLNIRGCKRFLADYDSSLPADQRVPFVNEKPPAKDSKVAVIGAGPAGLTCAWELAKSGYPVTVFEKLNVAGGYLYTAIPEYRLPKNILDEEVRAILDLGVELKTGVEIGKDVNFNDLKSQGFKAIFIGAGATKPAKLNIPGEELDGVVPGEEFLEDVCLKCLERKPQKVAVIGGGNTAIDCARVSKRLGCDAAILYRRTENEMPANFHEIHDCKEEGIPIEFLVSPNKIIGENGRVTGIECVRNKLGEPDKSGRRRPVPIPGSEFVYKCDFVMPAISRTPEVGFLPENIKTTKWCTIEVNEVTQETSEPGIFAGGDVTLGPATVVEAIACGKRAALGIRKYLETRD